MKTKLQKVLFLAVCLFASVTAMAYDFESEGFYYNITSDLTVEVTSGDNQYTGSVTIPSQVIYDGNSYSVTSIGNSAFDTNISLTSVTIPNSVTTIGDYAFRNCCLTSVTIPDNVTSIGLQAFWGDIYLSSVNLINSNITIGIGAFAKTAWFSNQPDGVVYLGLLAYTYKNIPENASITIKDGTVRINDFAFFYTQIASVEIPNSVKSIGAYAFMNCSGLTSVNIPDNVKTIGTNAFQDCF